MVTPPPLYLSESGGGFRRRNTANGVERSEEREREERRVEREREKEVFGEMMLGEGHRPAPAIHVPPWPAYEDVVVGGASYSVLPVSGVASGNGAGGGGEYSPYLLGEAALAALQRFLPSNEIYGAADGDGAGEDSAVDAYSCDEFRIYEFKVRRCARGRSHDWTECPYAHPGEKARRRDPRKYHYSGIACPEFRKGCCKKGDACEYAHGVFECWLHPARYRTQPCKDGVSCRRRVCFFAHTPEQLRVLPQTQCPPSPRGGIDDGSSPLRHPPSSLDPYFAKNNLISSPTSTLISPPMSPPSDSPPMSPNGPSIRRFSLPVGSSSSMNEVLASFRQLQLSKAKSVPASWGIQVAAGLGSPCRSRQFCSSLPATPMGGCGGLFEDWGEPTERVESGRDLRAKIYEKLSKEIGMGRAEEDDDGGLRGGAAAPDVGWVSDLLK